MKKLWIGLLAAGLVLGGCQSAPEEAPTLTILPSKAPTNTVTSIPATATYVYQSPTPRATPAIESPLKGAAYRLVTPELDSLVGQYFTHPETRDITEFLALHYYPEGRLPYQSALDYVEQSDPVFFFPPYFRDLVAQAISDYIVDNHINFEEDKEYQSDLFSARAEIIELDGDPGPEWLVRIEIGKLFLQGWLTFNQTGSGELQPLASPRSISSFNYSQISPTLLDFDRDGVEDLLFMAKAYLGGGGNIGSVNIYQGTPAGYTLKYKFEYSYNSKWSDGYWFFTLAETDPPAVVITNEKSLNWGCEWSYTITVGWKNGKFRETHAGEKPPNTPECLIAKSTHWMDEFPESGILNLNTAINQIANDPEYHPDLEAFARFRLALLYAVEGNISAARNQLEAIDTLSENYRAEGAQFITSHLPDLLTGGQVRLPELCSLLRYKVNSEDPISSFWKPFLDADNNYDLYDGRILCPSADFISEIFSVLPSPSRSNFEQTLNQFGITVLALESYTTEEGKTLWAGVFDAGDIHLASYQPNQEGFFEWHLINWTPRLPPHDRQWFIEDLNGDRHNEIAFSYSAPYWTKGVEKSYRIYLVIFDGTQIITDSDYAHQTSLDLRQRVAETYEQDILGSIREKELRECENDFNIYNSWYSFDEKIPGEHISCHNELVIYNLELEVLGRDLDAETRALLEHARGLVDLDDDYGPEAWQNLSYLIALSHELEGNTCEAIAGYLAVWESQPVSPWNALAASHLETAGPDANAPACSAE